MEPLCGRRLANNLPADWAFRWLWNQQEVTCVLSGMNSMEMVEENIRNASHFWVEEFTQKEEKLLKDVVAIIGEKMKVGCTGCDHSRKLCGVWKV